MKNPLVLLFLLITVSCSSPKKKYLRDYREITTHILTNYEQFSDKEWELSFEQYVILRDDYSTFEAELTTAEKKEIDQMDQQMLSVLTDHLTTDTKNKLRRFLGDNALKLLDGLQRLFN